MEELLGPIFVDSKSNGTTLKVFSNDSDEL